MAQVDGNDGFSVPCCNNPAGDEGWSESGDDGGAFEWYAISFGTTSLSSHSGLPYTSLKR